MNATDALSTKTSDLLDTILLNPGLPVNWAQTDDAIIGFGLQDPDYSQYKVKFFFPYAAVLLLLNRLFTTQELTPIISNNTAGFGSYLACAIRKEHQLLNRV